MKLLAAAAILTLLVPRAATAQAGGTSCNDSLISFGTDALDRLRLAQIAGGDASHSLTLLRDGQCLSGAARDGIGAAPAFLKIQNRTGYAGAANDGLLWSGRGLSAHAGAGIRAQWKFVSAALAPEFAYAQNTEFPMRDPRNGAFSPWADTLYLNKLDKPVRFGSDAYSTASLGQSFLAVSAAGVTAGASTQSLWIGPGIRSTLLMTNTAPGFPHIFVGTARPAHIGIGRLSAQLIGGQLHESEFYDTIAGNDRNALSLMQLEFEPAFIRGLHLGFNRVFVQNETTTSFGLGTLVKPLFQSPWKTDLATEENPTGSSMDNQLMSFTARWILPASDAEFYAEWGREDHSATLDDFIQEPDHSQAYILGFQKALPLRSNKLVFGAELTNLQHFTPLRQERRVPTWYIHNVHGYSNRGELLGSWIGPGGDSQWYHLDLFAPRARISLTFERVRRNETMLYRRVQQTYIYQHDVELTLAGRHVRSLANGLSADARLEYSSRKNREFIEDSNNLSAILQLRFTPGSSGFDE